MRINRENYELYFIDFFDGTLSKEDISLLMNFLDNNPDLKGEFQQFENVSVYDDQDLIVYHDKDVLKKPGVLSVGVIHEDNYQEYFVAYQEEDLTEEMKQTVDLFVEKNPDLKMDFELFAQIRIIADDDVVFNEKDLLKKKVSLPAYRNVLQYAASVLVIFGVGFLAFTALDRLGQNELKIAQNQTGVSQFAVLNNTVLSEVENTGLVETDEVYYNNVSQKHAQTAVRIPSNQSIDAIEIRTMPHFQLANTYNNEFSNNYRNEYSSAYTAMAERDRIYGKDEQGATSQEGERLFDKVLGLVRGERENTFNGWQIAEYGVKGFNLLTNNDVGFQTKNNEQGEVSKVMFNDFAVPVKRDR